MSKNILLAVLALVTCGALVGFCAESYDDNAGPSDFDAMFVVGFPGEGDFDLYDNFIGAEFQYRKWINDPFGIAFAVGGLQSKVHAESSDVFSSHIGNFDGTVRMFPVGVSAVYKLAEGYEWVLIIEGGIRYVFVDSDVTFRLDGETRDYGVDIGNGVIGLGSLEYTRYINETTALFGGAGAQFDINEGSIEVDGASGRDSELQGFFIRFGARFLL